MGESWEPAWNRSLGTTESGEPFADLLWDGEAARLRSELGLFPPYLLGLQRLGSERGTVLQIAVRRGQAEAVSVVVEALLAAYEGAHAGDSPPPLRSSYSEYVSYLEGWLAPRLVNEDPLKVGSITTILGGRPANERAAVATALLPLHQHFIDPGEKVRIALFADEPRLLQDGKLGLSDTDLLLLSLEHGAEACLQYYSRRFDDGFEGLCLLHEAAAKNYPQAIRSLIDSGENPNERNPSGQTPLHRAVANDAPEATAVLLEAGADHQIENYHGDSPLLVAIANKSTACAALLATMRSSGNAQRSSRVIERALRADMFELVSILLRLEIDGVQVHSNGISSGVARWLFSLLLQVLDNCAEKSEELMPLLTLDDFTEAAAMLGLACDTPDRAVEYFLQTICHDPDLYTCMSGQAELLGAPLCLLLCAASVAVATTKENNTFHHLHPLMRAEVGPRYEDQDLGEAWRNLRLWLSRKGCILAWPEDSWLVNVAAPLYHAIWRPDDREVLFDALDSLGINFSRSIKPEEMGVLLDRKITKFSAHIQRMLKSKSDRQAVILSACASLAASRDKRSHRGRAGNTRIPWAILAWRRDLRTRAVSITAILPCREGMSDTISFEEDQEFASNGETYQRIPLRHNWLSEDGRLRSKEGHSFRAPELTGPLVFRASGDKSLNYSLAVGETQLIICPKSMQQEIGTFLKTVQDCEVRESVVEHFPDLVALGPITPVREVGGRLLMRRDEDLRSELEGGLRLRGTTYHQLVLPIVLVYGEISSEGWSWIVDGNSTTAEVSQDEDGQWFFQPPTNGTNYCLVFRQQEITRFKSGPSVSEIRDEECRQRWPLLLHDRGHYKILGKCGDEAASVRFTSRTGLPTVGFQPCWSVSTKARPLVARIPFPDGKPYPPTVRDFLSRVHNAASGDCMSQTKAQRSWEAYAEKASQ